MRILTALFMIMLMVSPAWASNLVSIAASNPGVAVSGGDLILCRQGTQIIDGACTANLLKIFALASPSITGNATVAGTLGVTGASTLTGAATLSSTLAVTGASTLTGAVTAGSTIAASGQISTVKTYNSTLGTAIASAATIAPTTEIVHITGTAAIATITPPTGMSTTIVGCITLIADGAWTTTTAGNIFAAMTAVAGVPYQACYDGSKWYIK